MNKYNETLDYPLYIRMQIEKSLQIVQNIEIHLFSTIMNFNWLI